MADDEELDAGEVPEISELLLRPTTEDYEELFNDEEKLVLTTVVSKKCPFSATVTQQLSKLSKEEEFASAKLKYILADADEVPDFAKKLEINSVPHFVFSLKGEKLEGFSGSNFEKVTALLKNTLHKRNEAMKEHDAEKKAAEDAAAKAAEAAAEAES
eukprot:TRINITY_DN29877_c0_g1_i1.p2 TRINITY_DN29877_c0_g1~~TRINITY_DN29877_c0_g1_i1.p2  ORF type:complete len:158 (+),score=67.69 TRINITY_DN29877_c0_g1_i1:168-641(+)